MFGTTFLTSVLLVGQATVVPAVSLDPGPRQGAKTEPWGYQAFVEVPGSKPHRGGSIQGHVPGATDNTETRPTCVVEPGTTTTVDVCSRDVSPDAADHAASIESAAASVTPQELAQEALSRLVLPALKVQTAPPRGRESLVGLREFYWAAKSGWHPLTERAEAGGVWAQVTATPSHLVVRPGTDASVTCDGPGTPFDFSRSPASQDTGCTYLYQRSSAGMPGSAYRVTAEAVWNATWVGSGGAGGALPSQTRSSSFPVRVAEGQALTQRRS